MRDYTVYIKLIFFSKTSLSKKKKFWHFKTRMVKWNSRNWKEIFSFQLRLFQKNSYDKEEVKMPWWMWLMLAIGLVAGFLKGFLEESRDGLLLGLFNGVFLAIFGGVCAVIIGAIVWALTLISP